MNIVKNSIDFYVDKLAQGKRFSFMRYGDGEWNAIKRKKGTNCDKHEYFKPMGNRLKESLIKHYKDDNIYYGIQTLTDLTRRDDFKTFDERFMVDISWHNSDVFHSASEAGQLRPLVDQLKKMHVCIVGPRHLRQLRDKGFMYTGFIEIPDKNCYLQMDKIKKNMLEYNRLISDNNVVYALSASMAAEIIIHDLFRVLGQKNWLIDFGSLWDIYAGKKSRRYHSRMNEGLVNKNLGWV